MTETLTQTWTEQVLEEHRELREQVARLRKFLSRPRPEPGSTGAHTWAAELSRKLVKLHDNLFRHFRFEDEGGMAEEITLRDPRFATDIDRLVGEHPRLLHEVRDLMNQALTYSEGRPIDDPALRTRVAALLDHLEAHEHEETDIIQRVECDDIGAAD